MKKVLSILLMCVLASTASAQKQDMFNHLSAGVTVGTPGWGIDLATPVCNYVTFRTGFTMLPKFKYSTDLSIDNISSKERQDIQLSNDVQYPTNVDVEGKINFFNWKFLFDIYPFQTSSFHVTVGAYLGSKNVVDVYNTQDGVLSGINDANDAIDRYNSGQTTGAVPDKQIKNIGLELGDYLLTPDENGNAQAEIRVSSFKPYVGLGFGRAVPKKHKFNVQGELGVMFWGTPKLYSQNREITKDNIGGDGGDFLETMSKITVYPVLNIRFTYRLF